MAIHPLGDSYSHTIPGKEQTFPEFFGHLDIKDIHSHKGSDADFIHLRKEEYLDYVKVLYTSLSKKNGIEVTEENVKGLQGELWGAIEKARIPERTIVGNNPIMGTTNDVKTNDNTINTIKELARQKFGLDSTPWNVNPERNNLPNHGVGRGRGDEAEDLKRLFSNSDLDLPSATTDAMSRHMIDEAENLADDINQARERN